jgi:transmembrane sensor
MSALGDWIPEDIPEPIMEDAARWMAVLDSSECNDADRLSFARWLDEDPLHRWAFQDLSEVWAQLRTLSDVRPLLDQPMVHRLPGSAPAAATAQAGATPRRPRREWSAILAAGLVVLAALIRLVAGPTVQKFTTDTGELRVVKLADGSTVELNARSTLSVEFDRDARYVRLSEGDAVFHVVKDRRPFVVATGRGTAAALGTSFAVQQSHGETEVAVLEGRVAVTRATDELPLTVYDGKVDFTPRPETAVLSPGERVAIAKELAPPQAVSADELERDLAWRDGYVVYTDEPLQAVISDMRRYSRVSIHLADHRLRDIRVSGRFRIGDATGLLAHLRDHSGVVVEQGGPRWVVLRAGSGTRYN